MAGRNFENSYVNWMNKKTGSKNMLHNPTPGLVFLAMVLMASLASSRPQYPQPDWNWEAVILSRNGPSTSTTPRPTRWTTTTLRSFEGPAIIGIGKATVERENLVPQRNKLQPLYQVDSSSGSRLTGNNDSIVFSLIMSVLSVIACL
ncbi:uncharacterized protein LOC131885122 isoform X2 [Tigriopus californicus]|uniref:uncharacterized protein LOC131885122 isoform X2 n=1 Tax=Tigriopus californicus TaxID=6832 RepID=UPI0027DA3348|nr:uncharacterized protein LOC131885122 isoform X2 [Tigriopus californicus]